MTKATTTVAATTTKLFDGSTETVERYENDVRQEIEHWSKSSVVSIREVLRNTSGVVYLATLSDGSQWWGINEHGPTACFCMNYAEVNPAEAVLRYYLGGLTLVSDRVKYRPSI